MSEVRDSLLSVLGRGFPGPGTGTSGSADGTWPVERGPRDVMIPSEAMRIANLQAFPCGDCRPDVGLKAVHGWLSPDGTLFACQFRQHETLAQALGFPKGELALEKQGWLKLANMQWFVGGRYVEAEPTKAQWLTIESWYETNGLPHRHFLSLHT